MIFHAFFHALSKKKKVKYNTTDSLPFLNIKQRKATYKHVFVKSKMVR